jgi:TetR/AcrR family transcriptional regulator, transcriptional repressor for nem operon
MTLSSKGAVTKLKILQAAADLFHKQGVRATSPEKIIAASGAGKGQFYHYFGNKDGLIHEVLLGSVHALEAGTAPISYACDSWADLEQCILTHIEFQKQYNMTRSCPIGTVANEVTENDNRIRRDLDLIFECMRHKLVTFLVKEKSEGRMTAAANADEIATFCLSMIQGAMLLGRIKKDSSPVVASLEEAVTHLKRYAVTPRGAANERRNGRVRLFPKSLEPGMSIAASTGRARLTSDETRLDRE